MRPHYTVSLVLMASVVASGPARATHHAPESERLVARCIARSAQGRPWLEKTLWGLRDQEGGWIGAEIANSDGSHDLGPLQINSWWVPRIATLTRRPVDQIRHRLKHDACFNVDAARWIFLAGLAVTRDYWKAVGTYHSPTNWRQRRYALAVASHLRRRFGRPIFARSDPNRRSSAKSAGTPRVSTR